MAGFTVRSRISSNPTFETSQGESSPLNRSTVRAQHGYFPSRERVASMRKLSPIEHVATHHRC